MNSFVCILCFTLSQLVVHQAMGIDPTEGFIALPFNTSFYHVQWPYNKPEDQRYSFKDGVHKLWVFANDKPHTRTSKTKPRTEIGIQGYSYSTGVWQFEGHAYVPKGTSGVSIMQVFGGSPQATTLMLYVYNGNLMYYRRNVLVRNIYNRWFQLNVIHDTEARKLEVYVDGHFKLKASGRGGKSHIFKCGVYAQQDYSYRMESHWKNIRVLKR